MEGKVLFRLARQFKRLADDSTHPNREEITPEDLDDVKRLSVDPTDHPNNESKFPQRFLNQDYLRKQLLEWREAVRIWKERNPQPDPDNGRGNDAEPADGQGIGAEPEDGQGAEPENGQDIHGGPPRSRGILQAPLNALRGFMGGSREPDDRDDGAERQPPVAMGEEMPPALGNGSQQNPILISS
jgi:hypothetical protein